MGKPRKQGVIDQAKHPQAYPEQLPEFSSINDAGEFFDTHSVAPYLDQMEEITEHVRVRPKKSRAKPLAPTQAS